MVNKQDQSADEAFAKIVAGLKPSTSEVLSRGLNSSTDIVREEEPLEDWLSSLKSRLGTRRKVQQSTLLPAPTLFTPITLLGPNDDTDLTLV